MKSTHLTVPIKLICVGLATVVSLAFSSATLAQPTIKPQMIAEFEEALEEATLHMDMLEAWDYVPEGSRCKDYLDMAESSKKALLELNSRYEGRYSEYREQAGFCRATISMLWTNTRAVSGRLSVNVRPPSPPRVLRSTRSSSRSTTP